MAARKKTVPIVAHFVGLDPIADDRFFRTARGIPKMRFKAVVPAGPAVPVEHWPNIEITLDDTHTVKLDPAAWGDDPADWPAALLADIERRPTRVRQDSPQPRRNPPTGNKQRRRQ